MKKKYAVDVVFNVLVIAGLLAAICGAGFYFFAREYVERVFGAILLPAFSFALTVVGMNLNAKLTDPNRRYRWLFIILGIAVPLVPAVTMLIGRGWPQ